MKKLILLNRSGMSPEVTCRKGRHTIDSILSRFSLASLICLCMLTVGVGNVWGAEETLTIDYDSFSSHGTSYSEKSWSASTSINGNSISGSGNVCFTDKQTYVQLKNNSPGIANSIALPGAIKSIAIKKQSGTNRSVTVYVGTSALTSSNYTSSGTSLSAKTVDEYGKTWFLTPAQISNGYTYFYIIGSSNALLIDEIVITFDNGELNDYELVTDASTLSAGDILVFANTANTAVASTFSTSNYLEKASVSISGTTLTTSAAMEFTLGGSSGSWTFTNGMSTLRATSTSALAMGGSSGVTTWTISISSNNATVAPSSNYQTGIIQYNTGSPRFRNYTSGQAVIQIYRKLPCATINVTGGDAVILPAGNSEYTTGDWKRKGAPTAYGTVDDYRINGYCVTLTQAGDYNAANGLQLKASSGVLTISGIKSEAGVDVDVVIASGTKISIALTDATTLTNQTTGTSRISTSSTSATLTISKGSDNAGYIKTITISPKSCSKSVILANNSPSNGTVTFSPTGPVATCDGSVNVTMTITPLTGYYLSAYSKSGVNTSNTPSIATSGASSQSAQTPTLTFAQNTNGTYTANATFSPILVSSLTLLATQTGQSNKTGSSIAMSLYAREGQANDPLTHSLTVAYNSVAPSNALNKNYTWSVRVKASGAADWTNVGFTSNTLNTNDLIEFNKNTGVLKAKDTEGTAEITITAADGGGASATATITITKVALTGVSVDPTEMEVYAGQKKSVTVTFTPANATDRSYSAGSSYTYVTIQNKAAASFNIEGKSSVTDADHEETVTVTTTDGSYTATVDVTVKPLPLAHFVDNIHNESFDDVVATVSGDGLTVTTTKSTPTHSDESDPGGSYNTCERQHLHLVGWILADWADANPSASSSEISGAGSGNFYSTNADIDLVAKNGKTFYAVWAKEE